MGTPQDRIPAPSDATSVNRKREEDPNVGWREFVRGLLPLPDHIKDIIIPSTEDVLERRIIDRVGSKVPYSIFPSRSAARGIEIDRLIEMEKAGFELQPDERNDALSRAYRSVVPEDVRANIDAALDMPMSTLPKLPIGEPIDAVFENVSIGGFLEGAAEISGVKGAVQGNPFELIEGPAASVVPFGSKLYSRIDKAVDAFKQEKATGAQWLKQITAGVPEPERKVISEILGHNMNSIYSKDEIKGLIANNYKAPVVEEVRYGGSSRLRELQQLPDEPGLWKYGSDYTIQERADGRFILRQIEQGTETYVSSFTDLENAMRVADAIPEGAKATKWSQYTVPGGQNYEEIVLTTPEGGIFESTAHWEDVDNPIAHLRMTTRETFSDYNEKEWLALVRDLMEDGYSEDIAVAMTKRSLGSKPLKVRQIDELQSDWAQKIRREHTRFQLTGRGGVRPGGGPSNMPDVELGELITTTDAGSYTSHIPQYHVKYGGQEYKIIPHENGTVTLEWVEPVLGGTNSRLMMDVESAKEYIKTYSFVGKTPDMPFSNTDQWVDITLERAIQNAIDEGTDMLTWAPGQIQYDLYGSNLITWEPGRKLLDDVERVILRTKHLNSNTRVTEEFFDDLVGDAWDDDVLRDALINRNEAGLTNNIGLNDDEAKLVEDYLKMKDMKSKQYDLLPEEIDLLSKKYPNQLVTFADHFNSPTYILEEELAVVNEMLEAEKHINDIHVDKLKEKKALFEDILKMKQEGSSKPTFMINAKRQYRGEIPGIGNLEDLAANQNMYGEIRETASSQADLESILRQVMENNEDAPKVAAKMWERMQSETKGISLPRKEGMDYFYDKLIPARIKAIGKKMGIKLEPEEIRVNYPQSTKFKTGVKQLGIRITDELKALVKEKGWPLLGIGGILGGKQLKKQEQESTDPIDQLFD